MKSSGDDPFGKSVTRFGSSVKKVADCNVSQLIGREGSFWGEEIEIEIVIRVKIEGNDTDR